MIRACARRLAATSLLLVIGVGALLFAGGCRPAANKKVEIDFWGMGREGEVVRDLIPEFEREHPGIHVRVQQLPWSAAHEKLLTAFAGNATPDICQLGSTWVSELGALDALEDLRPRIAASPEVAPEQFFPGAWEGNVIDDCVLGVPWYVDTRLLFYRSDILGDSGCEHPPKTWSEWCDAMEKIKAHVGPDKFAIFLPLNEFEPEMILGLQQPDGLLRDNGRYGNFESEGFRKAFTFYVDMFRKGWAPPILNNQISNVWHEFSRGYFTFYITGPWNIGEFKRRLPPEMQDSWMTAPMPGPDASTPGWSVAGGASLAVFKDSPHKAEAWALAEFLSRPGIQARFYELTGNLPANEAAWEDPQFEKDPYVRAFRVQLEHVKPTPKVPEWERITSLIKLKAEAVVRNLMTIDEALRSLDEETDALLEKRRWMLAHKSHEDAHAP